MELTVWIAILASFLVGAAVKALPHKPGVVAAACWGAIVVVVSAYVVLSGALLTDLEVFAAAVIGSLAAFFTGSALIGLMHDWRNRSVRPA